MAVSRAVHSDTLSKGKAIPTLTQEKKQNMLVLSLLSFFLEQPID